MPPTLTIRLLGHFEVERDGVIIPSQEWRGQKTRDLLKILLASQYLRDGTRVHGPATRDLDKFVIRAVGADGNELAATRTGDADSDPAVGQAISIPDGAVALVVNTGKRVRGRWNGGPDTAPD
jgi:hypothetical protein